MTWALDLARHKQAGADSPPLFGVILYTNAHPNMKKVLRDEDYWNALDDISGPRWAIFSIRAHPGHVGPPDLPPNCVGMMFPVWKEPAANRELLTTFDLKDTEQLPALIVFVLEGASLHRTVVPLQEATLEDAYSSLKAVVAEIANALKAVSSENLANPEGVFAAVNYALQNYRDRRVLKRAYRVLKEVRDWLPS